MSKTFQNGNLVYKVLKFLNHSWQPKVTITFESKDLSIIKLATLLGKLQKHETKLNRITGSKKGNKKRRYLQLKLERAKQNINKNICLTKCGYGR